MKESADERSRVDRTEDPQDPSKDVREEFTSYRERGSADQGPEKEREKEALREAELQPGSPRPAGQEAEAEAEAEGEAEGEKAERER